MISNHIDCSKIQEKSVIRSLVAEKLKHIKFMEEYVMCTEKHVLIKNGYSWVEKNVHDVEAR